MRKNMAPQATPDEVFTGPIDLDENEVVEEDRSEEAEVDDSPDVERKVRMVVITDKKHSDKATIGEKARNRRRWQVASLRRIDARTGVLPFVDSHQTPLEDAKVATWLSKYGPQYDQPFSGPLSFAHLPYSRCLEDETASFDIALLGLPFDTGVTYRPGTCSARFGPYAIRSASRRIRGDGVGYTLAWDSDPFRQGAKIIDCGDVPVSPFDNALAVDQIEVAYSTLLDRTIAGVPAAKEPTHALSKDGVAHPRIVSLGGDHTIVLPILRSLHKVYGPISVIHFDAHLDTWKPGARYPDQSTEQSRVTHGTFFYVAYEEGLIANSSIHAGIRCRMDGGFDLANDRDVGFELLSVDDIDDLGIPEVIRRIRSRVGTNPVYLSFTQTDLWADPGLAPATGTPEAGGWTTRELKRILRGLSGLNFVGVDIVEVAPAYDNVIPADITGIAAADFVTDFLSMAVKITSASTLIMSQANLESYVLTGTKNWLCKMGPPVELETHHHMLGSIKVIERFFDLPLDYSDPDGKTIRVFARNMVPLEKARALEEEAELPYCGPGFEVDMERVASIAAATLWLDQRGTGLSTPFSADLVSDKTDEEVFQYLTHFRADNIGKPWLSLAAIVRDCEAIRNILLGPDLDEEHRKWTILGQSFGGFCALTYLSFYPEGLKEVFITAGLPPLVDSPDAVYHALEKRVLARNAVYYEKYPGDIKRVRDILAYIDANRVTLPNGGTLTPSRFLQLGLKFGGSGGIDAVHQIVFRAANDLSLFGKLSYRLLQNIEHEQPFDSNPLYAILHEPLYCQGRPSNWSAERVIKEYPQHSWGYMKTQDNQSPIFIDMMDDYSGLRALKGVSQLLAEYSDWPQLYDLEQLAKNTVKVTAATFVDFDLAQATASAVKNLEQYISNQHQHDALSKETQVVIEKLFKVSKREYD
ncbi:hypothetical protein DXG01_009750 [Tephrocybe rancida]|nr:hypothetical protein DXG01_009750 [Tephrocybe rancida]